ncbi:hypothetical protein AI2602V1_3539 [Citrobacter freundii]|uniref:hypothetical protein n=1 Tax=Citrobacter freundii TaxID=546 RepID=UPI001D730F3D|nr:hypothetical protein [Citrobacter freundii]MDT7240175.1 hypothetical protein [Citrobacter freundii]CAE6159286.1 hypothetical protein AI2602V1_3539 [Citrobacter freundii]CAH3352570.1 hypothetical protein AI2602V1_3539 [Citrobacter freundii]CAH5960427.1 hypothetical protein AI3058V1_0655 [Citrobacter freundii]
MSDLAMKVLKWQTTGNVGVSSATMASIALGLEKPFYGSGFGAPRDPSDMLRCMKLLEAIPEIRDHFPTIAKRVPAFKGIIEQWDELVEVMNWECVGDNWRAPDAYNLIKKLRGDDDPHRTIRFS